MAAYQRMEADMTAAIAVIYLGVVQRIPNGMPVGGPRCARGGLRAGETGDVRFPERFDDGVRDP